MALRIGKPRITVGKPRVTVGGSVGRAGGDIIRSGTRVVERHLKAPLTAPRAVVDVIAGKPVDEALRDAAKELLEPAATTAELTAKISATGEAIVTGLAGKIGGESAKDVLSDTLRVLQPYPIETLAAAIRGLQLFIETGRLDALNPLAIAVAAEVANARNLLWDSGKAVPADVVAALPEELRGRASICRYIELAAVPGNTKLPKIAIDHLRKATAVCLVDLIVFKAVPGSASDGDRFYWSHELYHAQQYADWGLQKFVTKYVAQEMDGDSGNEIEEDADVYACNFFPNAQPHYITACPVPAPPAKAAPKKPPRIKLPRIRFPR
ncbi:MAG TPA: hypothetical protein VEX35_00400 [Allosphingosinicella sp.]|nr:hypothetical protein [Allosphingosinicella sp.]